VQEYDKRNVSKAAVVLSSGVLLKVFEGNLSEIWEPKGSQRAPKGSEKGAKGSEKRAKGSQKGGKGNPN
jgi:hypothetical protein